MESKELNIYQRLHNVMQELNYIQKKKGQNNLKYTFASHDDVTAKCREAFVKHRIYPRTEIIEDKIEKLLIHRARKEYNSTVVTEWDEDSFCAYIKMGIEFVNIDNPKETVFVNGVGQGIDTQDKACGKATSYAYKYALLKALALETGDDNDNDDGNGASGQTEPKTQTPPKQYNNSDKEPLPPLERCNEWAEFLKRQVNAKRYYQDVKSSNAPQEVKTHCNSIMYPKN